MIDYKLFEFASPVASGADYYIKACQLVGLGPGFMKDALTPWSNKREGESIRITLVRNPLDWLVEFYELARSGRVALAAFDFPPLDLRDFQSFVRSYITAGSSVITNVYRAYEADIVHRYEDLPWAIIESFQSFGISSKLLDNIVGYKPNRIHLMNGDYSIPKWMRFEIMRLEREVFDEFGYF